MQKILLKHVLKKKLRVDELVKIIEKSKKKIIHQKLIQAQKTFQALRIFVNKEISELINGIIQATKFLKPGGKNNCCKFSFNRGQNSESIFLQITQKINLIHQDICQIINSDE